MMPGDAAPQAFHRERQRARHEAEAPLRREHLPCRDPARSIHRVIATTAGAAIEAAAVKFKTDARKLIAVPAYDVAS